MTNVEGGKKHRILVVEDDIFLADLICRKFREASDVLHAGTTEEARKLLEKEQVDLMCLDIQLPGEDGITFLSKIRQEDKWKKLPVLIVSNFSQETDMARAKQAGANDYIVKANVDLHEIVDRAEELIAETAGH
jgi:DNA-binding response OmpR family regulator